MEEKNQPPKPPRRVPMWFSITAIISFVPVLVWPWMIASSNVLNEPGDLPRLLLITFPVYAVLSIYLAYKCLGERTYLSVILFALLWLSFIALWFL